MTCDGPRVTFTIQLDGLESGTFYDVVLERGKREEDVGGVLAVGGSDTVFTVTVGPEVKLKRYDFLTVRENDFGKPPGETTDPAELEFDTGTFSAVL